MSAADLDAARRTVLASFRWVDGHADIAAVLRNPAVISALGPALVQPFRDADVTAVAGLEARGFALGALVAQTLGVGLVLVRKEGSRHPGSTISIRTEPDWRGRQLLLRLHPHELDVDDRVLLVDDWVETGSQATAVQALVTRCGSQLVGVAALVDDCDDQVRQRLGLQALLRVTDLPVDLAEPACLMP